MPPGTGLGPLVLLVFIFGYLLLPTQLAHRCSLGETLR